MVEAIGDVEVSGNVRRHAERVVECSLTGRPTVTAKAKERASRDCVDAAFRGNFANAMIERVSNVEIALAVHGNAVRSTQRCLRGIAAIAVETWNCRCRQPL